jgi:hypothetical protein
LRIEYHPFSVNFQMVFALPSFDITGGGLMWAQSGFELDAGFFWNAQPELGSPHRTLWQRLILSPGREATPEC